MDNSIKTNIVCVGFGPASAGFLLTLNEFLSDSGLNSPEIICYERADDLGFSVSGVVSKCKSIKKSIPDIHSIPLLSEVSSEKLVYLFDPFNASRRSKTLKIFENVLKTLKPKTASETFSFEFPFIPSFMNKKGGYVFSLGQFLSFVGNKIMSSGRIQIWPASPVERPIVENKKIIGVKLVDQGVDKFGNPQTNYLPGLSVYSDLVVLGDGPYGPVGRILDDLFNRKSHYVEDWALGMKFTLELENDSILEKGSVIHTVGYPEPEIFGFLYVLNKRTISLGIFVPSWFNNPTRTAYRYLQFWMKHPYISKCVSSAKIRSWGAKSIKECGISGEPVLLGDGFVRIGEGSATTNVLTNSGVDEAWFSGVLLGETIIELIKNNETINANNLERYIELRRKSFLQKEAEIAKYSRYGFHNGFLQGVFGMILSAYTGGLFHWSRPKETRLKGISEYYSITENEATKIMNTFYEKAESVHDYFLNKSGWPQIEEDGKLFISHQDALLLGGKVYAPSGFKNHVTFINIDICKKCTIKTCIEMCSGQAITPGKDGVPNFDREKCVHCGACIWNCSNKNVLFEAGAGGLHSNEN